MKCPNCGKKLSKRKTNPRSKGCLEMECERGEKLEVDRKTKVPTNGCGYLVVKREPEKE